MKYLLVAVLALVAIIQCHAAAIDAKAATLEDVNFDVGVDNEQQAPRIARHYYGGGGGFRRGGYGGFGGGYNRGFGGGYPGGYGGGYPGGYGGGYGGASASASAQASAYGR